MSTLTRELRHQLEKTVRDARRVAEAGAAKSLEQLGVAHAKAPSHLAGEQAKLRNALRAHGRQLGDLRHASTGTQALDNLLSEFAYQHWHRMLFARFLAENELLIEPDSGVAISLDECRELARELGEDWLALASRYAQTMLPQIFRVDDPVLQVNLPPETRSDLEDLLKGLPGDIFSAEDSLGWVYQFWQADRKEDVDRSIKAGNKAGAAEIPAKTQLFTEDYMVWFLLHNTLGAWWAGKVLAENPQLAMEAKDEDALRAACAVADVQWTYLRFVREGEQAWCPAAGTFDGWPNSAKDITLLDPCMGSGHFLVFALPILAAMRAQEEELAPNAAIEAVLRDNLYGLELDPRCTQIAAFNLALAAWRRVGFRALPSLHLACSGLSLGVSKTEWLKLAERTAAELPVPPNQDLLGTKEENLFSDAMRRGFERLYDLFAKAPTLGSLIQPRGEGDLIERSFADLQPLLAKVMARTDSAELSEMAVAAQGLAKAAEILAGRFTLVATNVPYLKSGNQVATLKDFCKTHFTSAKSDLATCFIQRCIDFCGVDSSVALVTPQNWLYQPAYTAMRRQLLEGLQWNSLAKLGSRAFGTTSGEVVKVSLVCMSGQSPVSHTFCGIEASEEPTAAAKASALIQLPVLKVKQSEQLKNPEHRIVISGASVGKLLVTLAESYKGITSNDDPQFFANFWEQPDVNGGWEYLQSTVRKTQPHGGLDSLVIYEGGRGKLRALALAQDRDRRQDFRGVHAWGKPGVAVSCTGSLPVSLYSSHKFDTNAAVIIPNDAANLPAIWAFCSSPRFNEEVRKIDQSLKVTNSTLVKVPFDLAYWQKVAAESYPHGLPKPFSSDPTQWLFNGHPAGADQPLQVAVARVLGYQWPRQTSASFPDCPPLGSDGLESHADDDGIVSLTPVKGEAAAAQRVRDLLATAYGKEWSAAKLAQLMKDAGHPGVALDDWLHDDFFAEHCAQFHHRPFVWHIWDGRRDGFNVLVNYHRLAAGNGEGKRLLSKLIYSVLGDWIDRQCAEQKAGEGGADARLAAAEHLKSELEKILAGEPPYDIFVRWKPLSEQAIGWEPDINDGVRMNIRPFMTARPFQASAKAACILRVTPGRMGFEKADRGKEPQHPIEDFPWFWGWDGSSVDFAGGNAFDGKRWNDLHYTIAAKQAARERCKP